MNKGNKDIRRTPYGNHRGPYGAIGECMRPKGTIQDHRGPYRTIGDHRGQKMTVDEYMGP